MSTKEAITAKLEQFIQSCGSLNSYKSLIYVGITNDINKRLFQEHKVDRESKDWICEKCNSSDVARGIEGFIITKYNTDGYCGGGNDKSCYIYAYKKRHSTCQ